MRRTHFLDRITMTVYCKSLIEFSARIFYDKYMGISIITIDRSIDYGVHKTHKYSTI